jgi:cytochrome b561
MHTHGVRVAGAWRGQTPTAAAGTLPAVRSLLAIGATVFVVACAVFALVRAEPHPSYPKQKAVAAAQQNRDVRAALKAMSWDHAEVIALDAEHWRVSFFDGPRNVVDAAVDDRGKVIATEIRPEGTHPPGSSTLWNPLLMVGFTALFILAVSTARLRSQRNADALIIGAGFTTSALLLDDRLVAAHIYAGSATLAYIAVRCAMVAFATRPLTLPSRAPLERYIPAITIGTLLAALMLVVTSTGISDVAFAGLAGGTLLNHGVSPYGHIPAEVVHGDTYPLLTYVLYMPFAAISPVRDSFDSLDGALWLNAIALTAGAAIFARWGARMALAWLAFPPVLLAASGGGNDVPAAVFTVAALATFGRERLSAGLLTLAGWVKIAPAVALLPLLARLRGRPLLQCLAVIAGLLAAGVAAMLAVGGTSSIDDSTSALRFQFERGSWYALWRQLGAPWVQVALQGLTVAVAVVITVFAARNRDMTLRRFGGLTGLLLALIQLSANYWTYAYLPWLVPFILVALFPPVHPRSPQSEQPAP